MKILLNSADYSKILASGFKPHIIMLVGYKITNGLKHIHYHRLFILQNTIYLYASFECFNLNIDFSFYLFIIFLFVSFSHKYFHRVYSSRTNP